MAVGWRIASLLIILISFQLFLILQGNWDGDFWEHAAVVNHLSGDLFPAQHPMMHLEANHAFYSPYLLVLACIKIVTGFSSITVMAIAAMVNLFLLLHGLFKFIRSLFANDNYRLIYFYAVLTVLFWWHIPFGYSGFISLYELNYVLPYPSTFCLALLFYILAVLIKTTEWNVKTFVFISILTAVVFITHPLTGIATIISCFSFLLARSPFFIVKRWLIFIGAMVLAMGLVLVWPYYSFLELITGDTMEFDQLNLIMYDRPVTRMWPLALVIPVALYYRSFTKHMFIWITLFFLCLLYVYGYYSGKWSYGRCIGIAAILTQVYVGWCMAKAETNLRGAVFHKIIYFGFTFLTLWLGFNITKLTQTRFLPIGQWNAAYAEYSFLYDHVKSSEVVLASAERSWELPAFTGKIVGCRHPQAFIQNENRRRMDDINLFFGPDSVLVSPGKRDTIVRKYNVKFVLTEKNQSTGVHAWIVSRAEPVFKNDLFVLYKLNQR